MPDSRELLARLADAFPRNQLGAGTLRVYLEELADVPPDVLAQAARALIRTSEFFPTVRAIREACAEHALALPTEADALTQIEARMRWAREPEADRGPAPVVHPLVREVLGHVGGFHAFRATEEQTVIRGQFLKLFRTSRAELVRSTQVGPLELEAGP